MFHGDNRLQALYATLRSSVDKCIYVPSGGNSSQQQTGSKANSDAVNEYLEFVKLHESSGIDVDLEIIYRKLLGVYLTEDASVLIASQVRRSLGNTTWFFYLKAETGFKK